MDARSVRVGIGYDLHRLVAGRPLVLGGVRLEGDLGLAGHSDGDAVLHAVTDAILGASGRPDLGSHFPDSDPRWRGASGAELLGSACRPVLAEWEVANLDVVVVAEDVRIAPHRDRLRESIAGLLAVPPERVNLKGKTAEGLGPIGEGKALECHAVVCLARRESVR